MINPNLPIPETPTINMELEGITKWVIGDKIIYTKD